MSDQFFPSDPAEPTPETPGGPGAGDGRARRPRGGSNATTPKRRMSRGAKAGIGAVVILAVLIGGGAGALWWMQRSIMGNVESLGDPFEGLTNRPEPAAPATNEEGEETGDQPMNVLVMGSDSRISAGDPTQWTYGAQRTDTMMLVHIPANRENVFVMSIPRDSWVDIPGYGDAKINAAFSYGGPSLTIETVENLTGVRIDHFVITDFESFQAITETLGGVELTLKEPFTYNGVTVEAGQRQLLTGEQALRWVRERKTLPRGDFDRMQRQQAWMRAMVAKVRNDGTLRNPIATKNLLDTVSKSIAADDGVDTGLMMDMLGLLRNVGSNDIVFFTAPYTGTGRSADGQSIIELDFPALDTLMEAWKNDTLSEFIETYADTLDTLPAVVN